MNKTFVTFLLGVVAGLLLAPDKGSETLKRLRQKLDDFTDTAEDEVDDVVDKGKRAYRTGKSKLSDAME